MGRRRGSTTGAGRARGAVSARAPSTSARAPDESPSGHPAPAPHVLDAQASDRQTPDPQTPDPRAPEPPDDYAAGSADDLFRALVRSVDGERVGRVSAVLTGPEGSPRWLVVATGLVRAADVPVPVEGCVVRGATVVVPHARDVVLGAPRLDPDRATDPQLEVGVRLHYAAAAAAAARGRASRPAPLPPPMDDDDSWWGAQPGEARGEPTGPAGQPPRTAW